MSTIVKQEERKRSEFSMLTLVVLIAAAFGTALGIMAAVLSFFRKL
jgi:hypothetical protein